MIKLNNENWPVTYCATGARGFMMEGYPFHQLWTHFGMNWEGTGFSGKTMTLERRAGNMPLKADGMTPKQLFPGCIYVDFFRHGGIIVNAVGLSGFGLEFYLKQGVYQKLTAPFFISIALESKSSIEQEAEIVEICRLIKQYGPYGPMAIQINYGCPNSDQDIGSFNDSICAQVSMVQARLNLPVFVNCNALMPIEVLTEVARVADGLWIGNTIPWRYPGTDWLINWDTIGEISPIRKRGIPYDGGLSGERCLYFTQQKVEMLRDSGTRVPIIAGNGIRTLKDVDLLRKVGASGTFLGSVAVVRPQRMKSLISYSNLIF